MQNHVFWKSRLGQVLFLFSILSLIASCGGAGGGSGPSTSTSTFYLNFDPTVVNHFQDKYYTLQNAGSSSFSVGTVAQANPLAAPFTITEDTCSGQTLAPNGSCFVGVRFKPSSQGSFTDSFDVPINTGTTVVTVKLSGEGVALNVSINQAYNNCPDRKLWCP